MGGVTKGKPEAKQEAAFFDLDKTVIARASIAAFGPTFYRGGFISGKLVLRVMLSQLVYLHLGSSEEKLAQTREKMLQITKGWSQSQVRELVREALEDTVEPYIYAEALELLAAHQAAGHRVYLVSASPEEIVQPIAEYLEVDGAIASRGVVDEAGCYTGEMAFYSYGAFKADALREIAEKEGIDLARSTAYSDSYTDAPMLEAVGHPVVVNPDRVLAKLARERGWEVMQFTKPVRLRDRVSVPSVPATATVAGATLVGAGIALVAWRFGKGRSRSGG